jgi:hypothetical protein
VLVCAVALSLAAQVVEAEPSVIGWIVAALPALGFLAMVKLALARTGPALRDQVLCRRGPGVVGGPDAAECETGSGCRWRPVAGVEGRVTAGAAGAGGG